MSDYRDPNEPPWRGAEYEPTTRGKDISWGWIAGVVAIVVLVAIAFGVGHSPTETASNETSSAATKAPPVPTPAPHPVNPALPGLVPPPAQGSAHPQ